MSATAVFSTFGPKAVWRVATAFVVSISLIAAAIYGQIGPGVHANIGSALGISMIALGGALGKWLLFNFEIGYSLIFRSRRSLYLDDDRLVYLSPRWMSFRVSELDHVEVVHWVTSRSIQETVRITPKTGEPKILQPGLAQEASSEIVDNLSRQLGIPKMVYAPEDLRMTGKSSSHMAKAIAAVLRWLLIAATVGCLIWMTWLVNHSSLG